MFRNQYDNDVTVWSPQGRIHQIEYAMEAVKQGSATVGLKSRTHAVLVALKRAQSELAAHQKKILEVDNHVGISIAGLTADARVLCNFMRQECLNSRFVYDTPLPIARLVSLVGNKKQIPTQRYGRRPYGVGLLIAGYDEKGPHVYQTCPSASVFDCKAMSIGARSQSARTYLERRLDQFLDGQDLFLSVHFHHPIYFHEYFCACDISTVSSMHVVDLSRFPVTIFCPFLADLDDLVKHGLRALRETLPNDQDLTTKVCAASAHLGSLHLGDCCSSENGI
uniref:Proteasome subunit alpha type n=1 Tax=Eptatretus burgeri TaxID=7764 RepID=A0A8C4Q475_EPTBU